MELAWHFGMPLKLLDLWVDSEELTLWMAFTRYFKAFPDPWRNTAMMLTATVGPNIPKDKPRPKVDDFVPVQRPPQHAAQDMAAVMALAAALEAQQQQTDG